MNDRDSTLRVRDIIILTIADTFGVLATDITPETEAIDVDGWDSLAHTVLMVRLGRAMGIEIPEALAFEARSVGELIDRCATLIRTRS